MPRKCFLLALIICLLLSGAVARAADSYAVTFERNAAVKMRDGITLRADIYRPQSEGKFPVLLQRTPYDKNSGVNFGLKAAARGYVVIFEDVRGRYASEGDWYTFKNESNDGFDTVEWAASLPYSNGRVGMFGGSYVGATQMLAAIARPTLPESAPWSQPAIITMAGRTRAAHSNSGSMSHGPLAWRRTHSIAPSATIPTL